MKLTTTLALALLVAASVALYMNGRLPLAGEQPVSTPTESPTAGAPAVLKGVTPEQITHLAVHHDGQPVVVLDRQGSGWTVAPGWPANPDEVQTVLDLVTHLHSRFAPVRADNPEELARYGLER